MDKQPHTPDKHSLEEAENILARYPGRCPIIVKISDDLPAIDKFKYLVPESLTVGQFIHVIRTRLKLDPSKALFMFVQNTIPHVSMLISTLYASKKSTSKFLFVLFTAESAFGSIH